MLRRGISPCRSVSLGCSLALHAAGALAQPSPPPTAPVASPERPPWMTDAVVATEPAPGRVALRVESTGAPLTLARPRGEFFGGYGATGSRASSVGDRGASLCRTPCTLYVRPGPVALHTSGEGVASRVVWFDVAEGPGASVRLHATSSVALTTSLVLAVTGVSVALLGPLLCFELAPRSGDDGPWMLAAGVLAGAGAAVGAVGLIWVRSLPLGVQSQGPLGATVAVGAVPVPGGAVAMAGVRF